MPQIEPRMISNQLQSSVFLYTCQSADVMEIIKKVRQKMDAVKNSCHVLLQGEDSCVHVLTRTTVVFQNINESLPVFFLQCIEYILIRIVDIFKLRVIFDNQVKGIRKQCLDELDVLGIQVDNYEFHRSSFPVRVAVHEVLPDCLLTER